MNMGLRLVGLIACSLVLAPSLWGAPKDPGYWLSKMQVAAIEANYKGTFVFSRGPMSSSVRVVHRFKDGFEEERLTQLDGQQGAVEVLADIVA